MSDTAHIAIVGIEDDADLLVIEQPDGLALPKESARARLHVNGELIFSGRVHRATISPQRPEQ